MKRPTLFVLGLSWLALGACDASGCASKLSTIPGGFPAAARTANATQLRVSNTGMAQFEAHPELFAAQLLGGSLELDIQPSCGGSPSTCCTGGNPVSPCGPLLFDVTAQDGDQPRVELAPAQSASRVDVTLRARIVSQADVPINLPLVGDCGMRIDTAPGATEDVTIQVPINFTQDAVASTTRMTAGSVSLTGLTSDDITIIGGIGCQTASLSLSFVIGTLTDVLADRIRATLDTSACKPCASGDVDECGEFADACTDQVCMRADTCLQEIGLAGRLSSGSLFSGAPPGSAGALDLYEVAGGYATTNSGGAALGILAGALPAGAARDRCGPSATEPSPTAVSQSTFFQGNTRPDTGGAFDVALGFHTTEVERFAYAAYEGGVLCATVDTGALPTLTSSTLDAALPSLAALTGGEQPVHIGLRPQAPPTVTLGANTFDGSDEVLDPLLDVTFAGMEIDLFVDVEQQPVRVLTLIADVHAPLGVQIGEGGTLTPVLGVTGAEGVSVVSSQWLTESESELEALAPLLVDTALPELVRRLDLSQLPTIGGMKLAFHTVTTVDSQNFLALFADLAPPVAMGSVLTPSKDTGGEAPAARSGRNEVTRAVHSGLFVWLVPLLAAMLGLGLVFAPRRRARRWALGAAVGAIVIGLPAACGDESGGGGADDAGADASTHEGGSADVDAGGAGNGASKDAGGEAGSGAAGEPGSGDGGAGSGGGSPDAGGDGGSAGTGGSNACGAQECEPGDVEHGVLGQWSSVAKGSRTVITSYDAELGDLVLVELIGGDQAWRVIDGVPNKTPTHDPDGYRGGVEQPGPDVGAWSSVRLAGSRVVVAYQDRDRGALLAAFEDVDGEFHSHVVDDSDTAGVEIGAYASLVLGSTPSIAYVATGIPGSGGKVITELRLATASKATPTGKTDWTTVVVASAESEAPGALALPNGPGLFVDLMVLGDGRRVLVHYDRAQRALIAHVETGAGSASFAETLLDGGDALDRGRWASAVVDDDDLVHVAYEDSIGHQVLYLAFTPGGAVSVREPVDDGTRPSERPHWVGASLALWLDAGNPRVAYQDAVGADVAISTKNVTWSRQDATSGAALDGFHIAAPTAGAGPLVWDRVDPAGTHRHQLVVVETP